jgi:hypothetical protein
MADETSHTSREPKIVRTLLDDLRHGDFGNTLRRDYDDLKRFMLPDEQRKRLAQMSILKRWFYIGWWLMKSMFFKLTPVRRILLVIALWLFLMNQSNENSSSINHLLGGLVLLFILMLELKDKLLAKKELEAGHAVQEALMPERSPRVPGWSLWLFTRAANEVGGDLVDFVQVGDNRYGVALGDVAGKGLSAALLTAKLQATIRALAPDFTSLADMGAKLNRIFFRYSLPNIFASFVYLEFQPESDLVRAINAGHIQPVIVSKAGVDKMGKGGVALGLIPTATYAEQQIQLRRGDLLIAYSDGLSEARNEHGEFFGEQRLMQLVAQLAALDTYQIGEGLVKEVDQFIGDARTCDDLSVAILRRA